MIDIESLKMSECEHTNFSAQVDVSRIEPDDDCEGLRFMADVKIHCEDCGVPMRFIGLPGGLDMNGAAVSADATEGRFAIAPKGEVVPPMEGVQGFSIRRNKEDK